jgi:methyltransferase family protein
VGFSGLRASFSVRQDCQRVFLSETALVQLLRRAVGASYFRLRRSRYFRPTVEGLSRLGERWDIDWLTYNPLVFAYYHEHAVASAPGVMRTIARLFPNAQTYVDVGAGSGAFAAEAQRLGRRTIAYEHSRFGRFLARRQGVDARAFDLEQGASEAGRLSDLVYCFEVAEHLDAALGDELVRFCAMRAPLVIFTAATPGQGGTDHKNEQPRDYWIGKFVAHGLRYNEGLSRELAEGFRDEGVRSKWLAENVMVFTADAGRSA